MRDQQQGFNDSSNSGSNSALAVGAHKNAQVFLLTSEATPAKSPAPSFNCELSKDNTSRHARLHGKRPRVLNPAQGLGTGDGREPGAGVVAFPRGEHAYWLLNANGQV